MTAPQPPPDDWLMFLQRMAQGAPAGGIQQAELAPPTAGQPSFQPPTPLPPQPAPMPQPQASGPPRQLVQPQPPPPPPPSQGGLGSWLAGPLPGEGGNAELMAQLGIQPRSRLAAIGQMLTGLGSGITQANMDPRTRGMAIGMGAQGALQGVTQGSGQDEEALLRRAQIVKALRGDRERAPIVASPGSVVLDPNDPTKALFTNPSRPEARSDVDAMIEALSGGDPAKAQQLQRQLFDAKVRGPAAPTVKVNVGGAVVNLPDTQPLTPANVTETQKGLLSGEDELSQLSSALAGYKRSYSTLPTQARQTVLGWQEYLGGELSPEQETQRKEFIKSRAQIGQYSAEKMNRLFGAALSTGEQGRARPFIPDFDKDSPLEVETKMEAAEGTLKAAGLRKKLALAAGLDLTDATDLARAVGDVDEIQRDPAAAVARLAQQRFPGRPMEDPEVSAFIDQMLGQIGG